MCTKQEKVFKKVKKDLGQGPSLFLALKMITNS